MIQRFLFILRLIQVLSNVGSCQIEIIIFNKLTNYKENIH